MKNPFPKIATIVLAIFMFTSCITLPVLAGQISGYTETRKNLPDVAYITSIYETDKDTFQLFGAGNQSSQLEVWETGDAGSTWQQKKPAWLETLNRQGMDLVFFISPVNDEQAYIVYAAEESGGLQVYLAMIDTGNVRIVPTGTQSDAANILQRVYFSPAGLLCIRSNDATVINPEDGKESTTFSVRRNLQAGQTLVTGSIYAILDEDHTIRVADLHTGKIVNEMPVQTKASGNSNAIAMGADERSYYYCDRGGLYRVTENETNLIMKGTGTALSRLSISNLFQLSDGSFLLLGFENDGGDRNKNDNRVFYHISR